MIKNINFHTREKKNGDSQCLKYNSRPEYLTVCCELIWAFYSSRVSFNKCFTGEYSKWVFFINDIFQMLASLKAMLKIVLSTISSIYTDWASKYFPLKCQNCGLKKKASLINLGHKLTYVFFTYHVLGVSEAWVVINTPQ